MATKSKRRIDMRNSGSWVAVPFIGYLLSAPILAQVTQRVSLATDGAQAHGLSQFPSISADGRYVAFTSFATNLVPADSNGFSDIFVRDRQSGTTERVSLDSAGEQGNGDSDYPSISADGRYVAFTSFATNLVAGDTNGFNDVFVRDRQSRTTELVSVDSSGEQGNGGGGTNSISPNGRYVAFSNSSTNLVPGDTNGAVDVFLRDRQTGTTELVSVDSSGMQANDFTSSPSISADGRYVTFESLATNLVHDDTNGIWDVFVRDRQSGTTDLVSVDSGGMHGNGGSYRSSISNNGRYIAFYCEASNLVPGDTNGKGDVFVHDRQSGTTERVSVASGGTQGDSVSFASSVSADGRYVAFDSGATILVPGDTNGLPDVFVRDLLGGTSFTSLCDPGGSGVIACPCSNPPSSPNRGCDNSSATGGASLSAAGLASLSTESLVFTTSGEKPTALSILLQGDAVLVHGVVYGQGVRCTGGSLKRLFVKTAAAGSITAPDPGAGDPTVSARSAAKGDVIRPGQTRWYLVFYRDPIVLGGCPVDFTFNATQTGQVTWWF
jgi:Tol biopolymer transport system component